MSISKVGNENLYLGGFLSLSNKLALADANITHVVTVMRGGADSARFRAFQHHLHIAVDDMDDEDLLQHFPTTNAFVQSGLASGGGVLIHWSDPPPVLDILLAF
ncbi:tyrosine protein phosphatase yvh1 [Ophidiomyces ophidiicola]|nr:tyrosine protein phosphatase yvh1 [Ophidiomyces ophidiicola]KAI2439911.1 tyrosine protein phosphatase yvh1 [Ophidiomyces ophidiicola]